MSFILREIFIFIFIVGNISADNFYDSQPYIFNSKVPITSNNRIMGVASIAGIMSRNGRVSSVRGIHFYPPLNSKASITEKNLKSPNKDVTDNMAEGMNKIIPNVSKWRKESDGNTAEGYISVYPGAVAVASSVSSSKKSGNIGLDRNSWDDPFNPMIWPMNDPFSGPSKNFNYPQNIDWIHRDIFNNYVPPNLYSKRTWLYPTFNPFLN